MDACGVPTALARWGAPECAAEWGKSHKYGASGQNPTHLASLGTLPFQDKADAANDRHFGLRDFLRGGAVRAGGARPLVDDALAVPAAVPRPRAHAPRRRPVDPRGRAGT